MFHVRMAAGQGFMYVWLQVKASAWWCALTDGPRSFLWALCCPCYKLHRMKAHDDLPTWIYLSGQTKMQTACRMCSILTTSSSFSSFCASSKTESSTATIWKKKTALPQSFFTKPTSPGTDAPIERWCQSASNVACTYGCRSRLLLANVHSQTVLVPFFGHFVVLATNYIEWKHTMICPTEPICQVKQTGRLLAECAPF